MTDIADKAAAGWSKPEWETERRAAAFMKIRAEESETCGSRQTSVWMLTWCVTEQAESRDWTERLQQIDGNESRC